MPARCNTRVNRCSHRGLRDLLIVNPQKKTSPRYVRQRRKRFSSRRAVPVFPSPSQRKRYRACRGGTSPQVARQSSPTPSLAPPEFRHALSLVLSCPCCRRCLRLAPLLDAGPGPDKPLYAWRWRAAPSRPARRPSPTPCPSRWFGSSAKGRTSACSCQRLHRRAAGRGQWQRRGLCIVLNIRRHKWTRACRWPGLTF